MEIQKTNAKQLPEVYYCKHMETGLAKYSDETILVDGDDIKKMIPTFVGKPVYVLHQDVDLDNLQAKADGYVTDSFYNPLDGWLWTKFIAVSDEAHRVINNGWSVSNAYIPTEYGGGGTHHNVPYDRKIMNGTFTHLAIVPDPRYEEAKIFSADEYKNYQLEKETKLKELQNNKGAKNMKFFKNTRQEVTEIDSETMIELEGGKEVSIQEMINAVTEKQNSKPDLSTVIAVGKEKMPLSELINAYSKMKKNEDDEDKEEDDCKANESDETDEEKAKKKEAEEAKEKENSLAAEKAATEKAEGMKHFEALKNAKADSEAKTLVIETNFDKLARGKERY